MKLTAFGIMVCALAGNDCYSFLPFIETLPPGYESGPDAGMDFSIEQWRMYRGIGTTYSYFCRASELATCKRPGFECEVIGVEDATNKSPEGNWELGLCRRGQKPTS